MQLLLEQARAGVGVALRRPSALAGRRSHPHSIVHAHKSRVRGASVQGVGGRSVTKSDSRRSQRVQGAA